MNNSQVFSKNDHRVFTKITYLTALNTLLVSNIKKYPKLVLSISLVEYKFNFSHRKVIVISLTYFRSKIMNNNYNHLKNHDTKSLIR